MALAYARTRAAFLTALIVAAPLFPVAAQQPSPSPRPEVHRTGGHFLSPAEAAAAAALLLVTASADHETREFAQGHRSATGDRLSAVGNAYGSPQYVLPALALGYLGGQVFGSPAVSRAALHAGEAAALAAGITGALKLMIGRVRPADGGDVDRFRPFSGNASFPSGHVTLAFAVATSLARETPDRWSDAALYGAATLTAFARINDDRHWASDALAGALIGHLVGLRLTQGAGTRIVTGPRALGLSLSF